MEVGRNFLNLYSVVGSSEVEGRRILRIFNSCCKASFARLQNALYCVCFHTLGKQKQLEGRAAELLKTMRNEQPAQADAVSTSSSDDELKTQSTTSSVVFSYCHVVSTVSIMFFLLGGQSSPEEEAGQAGDVGKFIGNEDSNPVS